ncbi:MAG TPA: hypothetical protein VF518_04360 [Polyangia bacterium]
MSDLVAVALCAAVVGVWASVAAGTFSFRALLACEVAFAAFYLVGSLVASWPRLAEGIAFDLPVRLLVGYAVVNTTLFVLAWASPLGIIANFCVVTLLAAVAFARLKPRRQRDGLQTAGLWAMGIGIVAATLWCQDALRPYGPGPATTLVKPWLDGFYHTVHIRIFGAAHGAASINDFRMSGVPARLYHYASYVTPGLLKQASGIPAFTAYTGLMVPMGIFFTGLGAYTLIASFWGSWAGVAACAALLLLPDGAHQGVKNTFMSYHWMVQIAPAATFGLALLAIAWMFLLRGCMRGSLLQVGIGWLVGCTEVVYKAQFFIASALLLFIAPPLFLRGLKVWHRIVWLGAATVAYVGAIFATKNVPGLPIIRLDGSTTDRLLEIVNTFADPGALRNYIALHLGSAHSWGHNVALGAPYLLIAALGLFAPLLVVFAIRHRTRWKEPLFVLPLLLVVNFLVMALGLALDNRGVATSEELQHRPFVWMYFALVSWVGGAAGLALVESRRFERWSKRIICGLSLVLLIVPVLKGPGIQRIPMMPEAAYLQQPTGLIKAAEFMRDHGKPQDLFQDAGFDTNYMVAALSDRQAFVSRTFMRVVYNEKLVEERAAAVAQLMQPANPGLVLATAHRLGIRWFLLRPSQAVRWPAEIANKPAFAMGGFRLYRFD